MGLANVFLLWAKASSPSRVNSKADGLGLMNGKAYMYSFEKLGLTIIMASRMQERARSAIARIWGHSTVSLCSQDFKFWSFSFIPVLVLVMAAVEREAFFFLPSFIFPQEIFDCFQKGADFRLFPSSSQSDWRAVGDRSNLIQSLICMCSALLSWICAVPFCAADNSLPCSSICVKFQHIVLFFFFFWCCFKAESNP